MKSHHPSWRRALGLFLAVGTLILGTVPARAVVSASNGFYVIYVNEPADGSTGQYTITTGPQHPAGSGLNVLYGDGSPGTSYDTIHSFTTGTDYAQTTAGGAQFLGIYGTVTALGTTGFRTTYVLPGPPTTPDKLTITQDVNIHGTTFSNSTVEVSTTIQNDGTTTTTVGVRYLWDMQIGLDDGPTFQAIQPNGPVLFTEAAFTDPQFVAFECVDNDVNPNPPTFEVFGTVTGPSSVTPPPTTPTLLENVSWANSFDDPFSYTITPGLIVAVNGQINDTAVLYYFGDTATNALNLLPAGSHTVSASLLAGPAGFVLATNTIVALACQTPIPTPLPTHADCVTRTARFWMQHPVGDDPTCVTLLNALAANGGGVDVGFICLPTTYRTASPTAGAPDAVIEALGLYLKSTKYTGEDNGGQGAKLLASKICVARKKMAVEMIAATANVVLLGTDPSTCQYVSGKTTVSFPTNLLEEAGDVITGQDVVAIQTMTAMLHLFNGLGQTNQFPAGLVECSATPNKELKSIARDPTTQLSCPGINNTCGTAQEIVSFPYSQSVNMTLYKNSVLSPSCATGGGEAFWEIDQPVAAAGRNFVVSTAGSNYGPLVSVWEGSCGSLNQIACSTTTSVNSPRDALQFSTDGSNTFYIVVEGQNGSVGELKMKVTSF